MKHLVLLVIFYACIAMQVQGIVAAESAVMMETVTETQPQKQQKRPAAKKKAASTATSTTATAIKQTKKVPSEFPYMDKGFLLSSQEFDFYNVNKGSAQTRTIKIKNNTGSAKDIFFAPLFDFISYEANPRRLAAGAVGEISVTFDSEKCPLWEKFSADFYLITSFNSTNKNSPKLTVVAEVVEDFTNLTAEQKKNAPKIRIDTTYINLGTIEKNSTHNVKFTFGNAGTEPLIIRRIINKNKELSIVACDRYVETGKTGVLSLQLDINALPAFTYNKRLYIQTNDPEHQLIALDITWTIK